MVFMCKQATVAFKLLVQQGKLHLNVSTNYKINKQKFTKINISNMNPLMRFVLKQNKNVRFLYLL